MSENLTEERIRWIVNDQLRIILDKGLMYSASSKPVEKPQAPETQTEAPKGVIIDLAVFTWKEMPATAKGPWEKAQPNDTPDYTAICKLVDEKGRPAIMEGYIVWVNDDGSLGRRKLKRKPKNEAT